MVLSVLPLNTPSAWVPPSRVIVASAIAPKVKQPDPVRSITAVLAPPEQATDTEKHLRTVSPWLANLNQDASLILPSSITDPYGLSTSPNCGIANLFDNDLSTCWQPTFSSLSEGFAIQVQLPANFNISSLVLYGPGDFVTDVEEIQVYTDSSMERRLGVMGLDVGWTCISMNVQNQPMCNSLYFNFIASGTQGITVNEIQIYGFPL